MRSAKTFLGLTFLLLAALPALCQDLVTAAPQAAKLEYEDARVRVIRMRIPPHGVLPTHDANARVVVTLTPNDLTLTRLDGTTTIDVLTPAGKAAWKEPMHCSVTNNSAAPVEDIVVELKLADGIAKPRAHAPKPPPPGYLDEKFHHWIFENQYVRVYDVRIPPGQITDFHVHAFDSVFVEISPGLTSAQTPEQPWGKAEKNEAGAMLFSADSKKSRTHRVRNDGTQEFHVIAVQMLP